jgi:2-oxoglutarate ferredoxin oxidoreductase subunit delta
VSRGTVSIDVERCKGCDLCVQACPPKVLEMSTEVNDMGYRFPVLHDGCTGCTACQLVCPDYVFQVYRFDAAPGEERSSGTAPGERSPGPLPAPGG